jgi:ABC-type lipoprotein export system ATPase subunit
MISWLSQDDPLSALDAHVGRHVFEEAIQQFLVKDQQKTVVLVTHHMHYLPKSDQVCRLMKLTANSNMKSSLIDHFHG